MQSVLDKRHNEADSNELFSRSIKLLKTTSISFSSSSINDKSTTPSKSDLPSNFNKSTNSTLSSQESVKIGGKDIPLPDERGDCK